MTGVYRVHRACTKQSPLEIPNQTYYQYSTSTHAIPPPSSCPLQVMMLVDRLKAAESAKAPAEKASEIAHAQLLKERQRGARLLEERTQADKQSKRFGREVRKKERDNLY